MPVIRRLAVLVALLGALWVPGRAMAEAPRVVASILPLHSLASQVMAGVGEPALLIEGAASPHNFQLRPSDARRLSQADLILWVGPAMEGFLPKVLGSLEGRVDTLAFLDLPAFAHLSNVQNEGHGHGHGHGHGDNHDHGGHGADAHIWLSPANAAVMLAALAERLAAIDPANAERYRANAADALRRLEKLDERIAAELSPVKDMPFVVFHDAYGAFVDHYGLDQAGYVTLSPERGAGAGHLREVIDGVRQRSVRCLFAEPQFNPAMLEAIRADTGARMGVLDPLGADLEPGPEAYARLMSNLAAGLKDCLADGR